MNYPLFLYLPNRHAILAIEPGTGDQLLQSDFDAGFNNYLNWSLKSLDGDIELMDDPEDGGMVLFNDTKQAYLKDPLTAIPAALYEAVNDPETPYVVLSGKNVDERGEISTMVTISTTHVTADTRALLVLDTGVESGPLGLAIYAKEGYGWFIYLDDMDMDAVQAAIDGEATKNTASDPAWEQVPDLMECILFAKRQGANVLCLDSDGEEVDDLKIY